MKIDKNIQENVEKVLDLEGKFVSPGFIDVHVHWREPGFEYKENIYHASVQQLVVDLLQLCQCQT